MTMRSEPDVASPPSDVPCERIAAPTGLLAATVRCEGAAAASAVVVGTFDGATLRRVRQEALAMRARHAKRVTIEVRFVDTADARALLATLDDLAAHGIRVAPMPIAARPGLFPDSPAAALRSVATPAIASRSTAPDAASVPCSLDAPPSSPHDSRSMAADAAPPRHDATPEPRGAVPAVFPSPEPRPTDTPTPAETVADTTPDPFDLDLPFRRAWLRPLRILFDHYWRIDVSGLEHVPDTGPALIAANHSGAIPADAFMLAVALELRKPPRCLRVLYDRFVDALPLIGPLYRRLGAFPASFPNSEMMLRRGELVGLFPEGIAGVEKRFTERYRLRPFKTGAARLALRTGAPIVPVAIVGAEEAYPVVARLYRVGGLVGLPWIPITPTFPLCGVAGAVPLPSKWHMHFCPPIFAPEADGRPEDDIVAETTARLREALATGVADLLGKRRGIFV